LLARYIHNLAEPPRSELISVPPAALPPLQVEATVLARCSGRRATIFLPDLERAPQMVHEELAQLLAESGAIAIEPIRWIASVADRNALAPGLREAPWIVVELPSLRTRSDLAELAAAMTASWAEARDTRVVLAEDAQAALADYRWPGNLRELESVLESGLAACAGGELRASDLSLGAVAPAPEMPAEVPSEAASTLEIETPAPDGPSTQPPNAELAPPPLEGPTAAERAPSVAVREIVAPLAEEIRPPLRALRTYANLLGQRPEDPNVREELAGIVEGDLSRVEATLQRLERFAALGPPELGPVDLPALVAAELQQRHDVMRERELVVLRELDHDAPPAIADEKQIRFAIGALLDRSLRMVPTGGDLYVGSLHREAHDDTGPAHRILIRFHSPEEVLIGPADAPGPAVPIEVVLARDLIERMGGAFAVDASGAQDNVILIELPA
jgi:signal transduction histidine kinase